MNLQNWVNQARAHWKEFQPSRYRALVKEKKLEISLQDAANRTFEEMNGLRATGFNHQEAWEIVRERYLFPAEEGKKPASDSPLYSPSLTDSLRAAMSSGARTVEIPQPKHSTEQ